MSRQEDHLRSMASASMETSDPEESENRRWLAMDALFVALVAAVSLGVYLYFRPPNRHDMITPYDGIIYSLHVNMSESEVRRLFQDKHDVECSVYTENVKDGSYHVLSCRTIPDQPLRVRFADSTRQRIVAWCYLDDCHDNIQK